MERKKNQNSQHIIEELNTTQLQDLLQSYTDQDSVVLVKELTNKSLEQNREPRNKPTQLIFDKGTKAIQWRKLSVFNNWCGNNWTSTCKKIKIKNQTQTLTQISTENRS